ncbi:MAG: DUF305 domain-containing protein [Propionibacterium sp.]|nr:DUF305 domain-containing protein [Propionibacterium sp.]HMQ36346.1 DUF305 domain-containing protein [Micropruina sp.]
MRMLARLALPIAAGLALAGCQAPPSVTPAPAASASAGPTRSANAADAMFAQMMIPHHEQAVVMSDAMLAKPGISAEVTTLATQIKNAQQPEIDQMRGWLKAWGAAEHGDHHGHTGMDGMLTEQELAALKDAQGAQAEKLFLTGMIRHHEGAVAMAKEVQANGADPDVRELADAIITSQQAEIDQMKRLLER